jgi:hypothetical protein
LEWLDLKGGNLKDSYRSEIGGDCVQQGIFEFGGIEGTGGRKEQAERQEDGMVGGLCE